MHPDNHRSPPVVPHRRYPSLCDDNQPWFPRHRISPIRVAALLAIIAIITVLAVSA